MKSNPQFSTIKFHTPQTTANYVEWSGSLTSFDGTEYTVNFQFSIEDDQDFIPHIRPFLLSFLLPAMKLGKPVRVEGYLDPYTIQNLTEWQEAYNQAYPELTVVELLCSGSEQVFPNRSGSLSAFSGGVDSCFSMLRGIAESSHTPKLRAGLMVQGFDIKRDDDKAYDAALGRCKRILESQQLATLSLKTDIREMLEQFDLDWGKQSHGIAIAAALACYECYFENMVIPSTFEYIRQKFPWGSSPATDHLFSSKETSYWHDGAAFNKLSKIRHLSQYSSINDNLRVCWEGSDLSTNCGTCFKCVATQLCYKLSGINSPSSFPKQLSNKQISRTYLKKSPNNIALFVELRDSAQCQGHEALTKSLNKALRSQLLNRFLRKFRPLNNYEK